MSLSDKLKAYYRKREQPFSFYLPQEQRRPEILLSANTVKPLHGVVPRSILGREWWDKTRMAAYRSTNFHCIACGVHKSQAKEHQWLEGHEQYSIDYPSGRVTYIETVPLCHYCHNYIHDGRMRAMVNQGTLSQEKFAAVVLHGNSVLDATNLRKPSPYTGPMPQWSDWRLILFDKEYPPLYPTYEAWVRAFGGSEGFDL